MFTKLCRLAAFVTLICSGPLHAYSCNSGPVHLQEYNSRVAVFETNGAIAYLEPGVNAQWASWAILLPSDTVPITFAYGNWLPPSGGAFYWYSGIEFIMYTPGNYTLTVTASNGAPQATLPDTVIGCSTKSFIVQNRPAASVFVNATSNPGQAVTFQTQITIDSLAANTSPTYHWNFGDGTSQSGIPMATQNVTHTYATPGTYTATMTVSDGYFLKVVNKTITVAYPPNYVGATTFTASATCSTSIPGKARFGANWGPSYVGGAPIAAYVLERRLASGTWSQIYSGSTGFYEYHGITGPRNETLRAKVCSSSACGPTTSEILQVPQCVT